MKKIIIISLLILFIFPVFLKAEEPKIKNINLNSNIEDINQGFIKANSYYEKGLYEKAIEEYNKIIERGIKNPNVYYNVGNAYYKTGKIGKSIINFERAKQLDPRNSDLNINLKFVKQAARDKIPEMKSGILNLIFSNFLEFFTINELTIITSLIYFILMTIILINILTGKSKNIYLTGFCILIFVFATFFLVNKIINDDYTKKGIVISSVVDIKSGPSSDDTLIFTIHEGTKIEILEQKKDYYEVILPNGEKGWLQKEKVEII